MWLSRRAFICVRALTGPLTGKLAGPRHRLLGGASGPSFSRLRACAGLMPSINLARSVSQLQLAFFLRTVAPTPTVGSSVRTLRIPVLCSGGAVHAIASRAALSDKSWPPFRSCTCARMTLTAVLAPTALWRGCSNRLLEQTARSQLRRLAECPFLSILRWDATFGSG
jgi:hypothetical protein